MFQTWLSQHSAACGGKNLPIMNSDGSANLITSSRLTNGKYQVLIVLDVNHSQQDLQNKLNGVTETPCESYRYRGKGMGTGTGADTCYDTYWSGTPHPAGLPMREMQASEAAVLASWVQAGGGIISIVGVENEAHEVAFQNLMMQDLSASTGVTAIQFSTYYKAGTQDDMMQFNGTTQIKGTWNGTTGLYGYKTTGTAAVLTQGVLDLRASNGFQVVPSAYSASDTNPFAFARGYGSDADETKNPLVYFGSQYATIGVAGTYGSGRVVFWGDEWITYDTTWGSEDGNTYSAATFWNNILTYLDPTCVPKK
jgi:hypothetical protein